MQRLIYAIQNEENVQRLIFAALFFLIGFGTVLYSGHNFYRAHLALNWPSVKATVVRDYCQRDTDAAYHHIVYRYTVKGRQYESDREEFGGQASTSSCQAHFKPGDSITAHFDPANPQEAVLKPGSVSLLPVFFGSFFMWGAWLAYRSERTRQVLYNTTRDVRSRDRKQHGGRNTRGGREGQPLLVRLFVSWFWGGWLWFVLVFLAVGLLGIVSSAMLFYRGHQSLSWVPVQATVMSDQCRRVHESDGGQSRHRFVAYEYTVQGSQYTGTRQHITWFAAQPGCDGHIEPGTSITAYYNPAHPAEAVLERGVSAGQRSSGMAGLVIGLIFLIFSAALLAMRTFVTRRVAAGSA